jgi:ATP-binding cassette subfamily C protein
VVLLVILLTLQGRAGVDVLPLLGLYAYAGFRMIPSANRILWRINEIRHGTSAVQQLYHDYRLLDCSASDRRDAAGTARLPFTDCLATEGVSYTYPGAARAALQDVHLTIRRGESIGIVGSTGAGKSTLVDTIIGLLQPDCGRVTVDNLDVQTRLRAWQRQIGYVPQSIFLADDSLRRNIAFGVPEAEIDDHRLQVAIGMAQLAAFVAALPAGLDTCVGERGIRLSGGERQRLGIARALYHEPEVLVFDEATSALDQGTEGEVMRAIEALHGKKTLLVIAHRLSTVRHCDRLIVLCNGRIIACGSFDTLMAHHPEFRTLAALTTSDAPASPQ